MEIIYDPTVDALSIRFVKEKVECETIHLSDQVAVDMIDPLGIERACPADETVHLIAFVKQKLS